MRTGHRTVRARSVAWSTLALALAAGAALTGCGSSGGSLPSGPVELGSFRVEVSGGDAASATPPLLRITSVAEPGHVVWESAAGRPFVEAAVAEVSIAEERGSFEVDPRVTARCDSQTVSAASRDGDALVVRGALAGTGCAARYTLRLEPLPEPLGAPADGGGTLGFTLDVQGEGVNLVTWRAASDADERFLGLGEQFTYLDLKGQRVPILVEEQGIGRGAQPLAALVNLVSPGSGGGPLSTYAAVPFWITSRLRASYLTNTEVAFVDLTADDEATVELLGTRLDGAILDVRAPKQAIERFTRHAGRMAPLPEWLGAGAVLGVQGGTDVVRAKLERVRAFDVPVAAFWLQDWEGQRQTLIGQQLWWNWVLDRERYPGWEQLVADLAASGIRVMTYVNPFLVDVAERGAATRNLFREAVDGGYLVKNADGAPYLIPNTSFSAGLLDLTNPATRSWFADVLRDEVLGVGASGWMLDFGEALPFDAVLASGESPATAHNRYPEDWAELTRQAVADAGRGDDVVFFTRSGFTRSPSKTRLMWLGDQLVTFDGSDGLASAVKGLLSGGLSGFALDHGDVGGYTSVSILGVTRSKKLLLRWMELGAFQPVFRTHEGNQPAANVQFDADDETLAQLARCTKVFRALGFYRRALMDEAAASGAPLLRHPWLEFPDDAATLALTDHLMLGSEILVVPVTHPGAASVAVYLPAGRWVHVWSGRVLGDAGRGTRVTVDAPIGEPAMFHREGSEVGATFVANLRAAGLLSATRR